jgi:hypothetical protein
MSELETLAFEGVKIDFQFNSDKPSFGDLFLIVGRNHPRFLPNNREFEKLTDLGFQQTDDYFGIKNDSLNGDDVKVWLYPIQGDQEACHSEGPFEAIRIFYIVIRNDPKAVEIFERVFESIMANLDVVPLFNGRSITSFTEVKEDIDKIVKYCREELNVDPGSDRAMLLDW